MSGKNLRDLNLKEGDVVRLVGWTNGDTWNVGRKYVMQNVHRSNRAIGPVVTEIDGRDYLSVRESKMSLFEVVSRATCEPVLWEDMTREEKGALLLAHHEGEVIQYKNPQVSREWRTSAHPLWTNSRAYRVKPRPVVEEVVLQGNCKSSFAGNSYHSNDTHRITFNTIDGEPDCASVKMEKIK